MERRLYPRNDISPLEVVIERLEYGKGTYENVTLFIDEVSREGMRFSTNIDLDVDDILQFSLPSLNMPAFVSGRIAWKESLERDWYQYGIQILTQGE